MHRPFIYKKRHDSQFHQSLCLSFIGLGRSCSNDDHEALGASTWSKASAQQPQGRFSHGTNKAPCNPITAPQATRVANARPYFKKPWTVFFFFFFRASPAGNFPKKHHLASSCDDFKDLTIRRCCEAGWKTCDVFFGSTKMLIITSV